MATFFGRYEYVAELGRGAGSRVLQARDLADHGAARALKIVAPDDGARLAWELARLSEIDHPNVARVRELLRVEQAVHAPFALVRGAWVLVEDLAPGQPADQALDALRDEPRTLLAAVFRVAVSAAEALTSLHRVGLVHGDVKPANLLATPGAKQVTLIDLGAARAPGFYPHVQGTPDYLAPEVWAGTCSFAQDTYALGATLVDLIEGTSTPGPSQTGAAPWRVRDVGTLTAQVPLPWLELLRRMLSLEPEGRPSDAMRLLAQLHALGRRLHLGVPRSAALYATGRVAPSALELGARALSAPFIGHVGARENLVQALDREGVVCVAGASGSGRTRLIREALRSVQLACADRGSPTPTLLPDLRAAERIEVTRAIVHQSAAESEHVDIARRAVAAWKRMGRSLSVVLEIELSQTESAADIPTICLGPLDADAERALLREVLGQDLTLAAQLAARAASGGYAGRLCVLLSQGLTQGRTLLVADEWADLTIAEAGLGSLSPDALRLARLLALSAGQLSLDAVSRLVGGSTGASHGQHELRARGLLAEGGDGATSLQADVARRVRAQLGAEGPQLARELAAELPAVHNAIWVRAFDGDTALAEAAFLAEAARIRNHGEPYTACAVLAEALLRVQSEPLRMALADAQRALGRYADAATTLQPCTQGAARLLNAEVARLRGDLAQAREWTDQCLDEGPVLRERASALLARIAFDQGDVTGARAQVERLPADLLARLRVREVRALLCLQRGEPASEETARLLTEARQLGDARSVSRALMLASQTAVRLGRFAAAAHGLREALARSRDAGEAHEAATIALNLGLVELDAGELGAALSTLRQAAASLVWLGRDAELARALYNLGNAAWLVGDMALAEATLSEARERATPARDHALGAYLTIAEAELALHRGEVDAAYARLATELARQSSEPSSVSCLVACRAACAALALSRPELAQTALDAALSGEFDADVTLRSELAVARARNLLARGDAAGAEAHIQPLLAEDDVLPYEARLRLLFTGIDVARAAGFAVRADERAVACRALLERALASLEPEARVLFRALPAHARALGQGGTQGLPMLSAQIEQGASARRLVNVGRRLFEASSEQRLARMVAQLSLELVQAERALVIAQGSDGEAVVLASAWLGTAENLPFSRSIVERVWAEMTTLVTIDAQHDARLDAAQSVHSLGVRSVIAVPIRAFGGRAVIYLDDRLRAGAFGAQEREQLADFAQLVAAAARVVGNVKSERRAARQAQQKVRTLEAQLAQRDPPIEGAPLIGESRALMNALHLARRVAGSSTPVLIQGESGTGKELLARFVHAQSERSDKPFVVESCAALPEGLLESALFGHERGAFTGADRARVGLFELAHTGTLFLDEVAEMSPALQAKLLRVLQDGEVRPVGSEKTRHVDVRILTATHRDLAALVQSGKFREDLYYRISVIAIEVPPLRDRLEDIPLLVAHFLKRHGQHADVRIKPSALEALQQRAWPGNVRQLESEIQRAIALSEGVIGLEHLSVASAEPASIGLDLRSHTDALQRQLVRRALKEAEGNQTRAAALLGVSRFGLQKMLKRLGLD